MKKEDLCMLLIVVALVLIISRNTKLFEGFTANDLPATMPESDKKTIMDMVASGKVSEEQLEQDTIKGDGYIKIADGNGVLVSVNNVHAGVIKAVHEFFDGQANVNNWGRYWYFKKS